jgi:hypothetical protein
MIYPTHLAHPTPSHELQTGACKGSNHPISTNQKTKI